MRIFRDFEIHNFVKRKLHRTNTQLPSFFNNNDISRPSHVVVFIHALGGLRHAAHDVGEDGASSKPRESGPTRRVHELSHSIRLIFCVSPRVQLCAQLGQITRVERCGKLRHQPSRTRKNLHIRQRRHLQPLHQIIRTLRHVHLDENHIRELCFRNLFKLRSQSPTPRTIGFVIFHANRRCPPVSPASEIARRVQVRRHLFQRRRFKHIRQPLPAFVPLQRFRLSFRRRRRRLSFRFSDRR